MTGAYRNAGFAAGALGVVEHGQVVHHCYGTVRALFGAQAAADAADFAACRNFLCLAVRGACDVYGSLCGDAFDYVFGAGDDACAAVYALIGIDLCNAAGYAYRAFGTGVFAVAAAETGRFAHLVAAEQPRARRASFNSTPRRAAI